MCPRSWGNGSSKAKREEKRDPKTPLVTGARGTPRTPLITGARVPERGSLSVQGDVQCQISLSATYESPGGPLLSLRSRQKELDPAAALGAWELRRGRVRAQDEKQDGELGTQPFNAYAVN